MPYCAYEGADYPGSQFSHDARHGLVHNVAPPHTAGGLQLTPVTLPGAWLPPWPADASGAPWTQVVLELPDPGQPLIACLERELQTAVGPDTGLLGQIVAPTEDGWRFLQRWDSASSFRDYVDAHFLPALRQLGAVDPALEHQGAGQDETSAEMYRVSWLR